jgi:transcriptional regulator NrdR family protein
MKPTSTNQTHGLCCLKCGGGKFRVIYTRARANSLMRRRECMACKARFTTWERIAGLA